MIQRLLSSLLLLLLTFSYSGTVFSQDFLLVRSNRDLVEVNTIGCTTNFLCNVQSPGNTSVGDMTFTPDGKLWGLGTDATLFTINTNNCSTNLLTIFPNAGEIFTAMVADASGLIYVADEQGDLYTYDPATDNTVYLGNAGIGAAGDLTFYEGRLIMATTANTMVEILLDDPTNPEFILSFNVNNSIFGIVTYAEDCNKTVTYATSGGGELYEIDFTTNTLSFVCNLGNSSFGAASAQEFLAANLLEIVEINVTDAECGATNGSVEIIANSSSSNIQYSLDGTNYQSSNIFTDLAPGIYPVFLLDDNDCIDQSSFEIVEDNIPVIDLETTMVLCGESTGSILVSAGGSNPPYQYSFEGGAFNDNNLFENLPTGVYSIVVMDAEGCTEEVFATIEGTAAISIDNIAVAPCGGDDSFVEVSVSGGNGAYEYSINGSPFQLEEIFQNLSAGPFTVSVQDSDGCTDQIDGNIPDIVALELVLEQVIACGSMESSITVAGDGGTAPFAFSINDSPAQSASVFTNLTAGTYSIIATDVNGCMSAPLEVVIEIGDLLEISNVVTQPSLCASNSGQVDFQVSGDLSGVTYLLDGQSQLPPPFKGLDTGTYIIEVIDQNGCSQQDTAFVGLQCPIYIPSAFSPNDDGRNDRFAVYSGVNIEILDYKIFNRWGGLVYERQNFFSNQQSLFWNGDDATESLNTGVYVYTIELINPSGIIEQFEGEIHLVR
jgi:gliding motility-associated-like protein